MNLLGAWAKPPGRDRISGLWRPVPDRDNKGAAAALRDKIDGLLRNATGVVQMKPSARLVGCVWRKPVRRCWRL